MMNDYFIKKYNEKRIRSSKTQDFFLKKKKLRKGRMSTKENNLKKKIEERIRNKKTHKKR